MSSRSEDKLLDEMFEPFITFFNDEDDFIVKFNELHSLSSEEWGRLVMKRLRLFQNLPHFKENFLDSDSVILEMLESLKI